VSFRSFAALSEPPARVRCREAAGLFAQGVREIDLIRAGHHFPMARTLQRDGLAQLWERLARIETPGPKWIRFLYALPNRITASPARHAGRAGRAGEYVDMPLQHSTPAPSSDEARRLRRIFSSNPRAHPPTIPGVAIRTA